MSLTSRDKHENMEYFQQQLEYSLAQRERFSGMLDSDQATSLQRRGWVYRLFFHAFKAFQCSYALGAGRETLAPLAEAVVRAVETKATLDKPAKGAFSFGDKAHPFLEGFVDAIHALAIARLCELPSLVLATAQAAVNHAHEDALLDRLSGFEESKARATNALLYPKVFQPLLAAFSVDDDKSRLGFIHAYMKHYYRNMRACPWHDRHLRKGAGYSGYWAWEAAAVVKLLRLDESSLVSMDYYPAGLQ